MAPGWLVDAVTLQHFGSIGRLSLLCEFLSNGSGPYWVTAVHSEILAGMHGSEACREVLACADLGTPAELPPALLRQVFRTQIELGGGGVFGDEHLGEAECIVLADHLNCGVVTDDNSAYDTAEKRFGSARVADTVDVLRALVRAGFLTAGEAVIDADAIVNNGRHLRRVHSETLVADDFK